MGIPLKDWDINIYRGILTGYNEAFIIDGLKKDELTAQDPKSAEIIRPILRGRDIKRYGFTFEDFWLINTHNGIKEKGVNSINIDDYPSIKKHLDHYYSHLEKRLDKGDTPYNLRNCAYMEDFSKQKLLWAETMRIHKNSKDKFPRFGFDLQGDFFTDKTCFFATGTNIKAVLAVLNSTMGRYLCYKYVSILDDGGYLMQKIFLEQIPIPQTIEKALSKYYDSLVYQNQHEKIENEIDEIVFTSYNLTSDEVNYIKRMC